MVNQILLILQADADIFIIKQLLLRADSQLEIPAYHLAGAFEKNGQERDENILCCLTDQLSTSEILRRHKIDSPILLVNADISQEELQEAYNSGVAGYLPGPLNMEPNMRRLQNYFDLLQIPLQVWPYCNIPNFDTSSPEETTPLIWWELH